MNSYTVHHLQAETFKALAHPLRLEILRLLEKKELCFSDILEETGGLKSNLSQHLSLMSAAGILNMRRDARCNYYSLASPKVSRACALMREVLETNMRKRNKALRSS